MLVREFSTEVVAAPERFALWKEAMDRSHVCDRLDTNDHGDFRAGMRCLDLGEIRVSALSFPHLRITRTPKLIRRFDPEVFQINHFLGGQGIVSVGKYDTTLRVGDLLVMDSGLPYRGEVHADSARWSHMTVQCPYALLPLPAKTVRRLFAVPISGRSGMGGVFAGWLFDLNGRAAEFTPADAPTLASVTVDLLGSVLARCLESEEALSPETRRTALRARIVAFVERHLADPDLTPRAVAEAHHISLRLLQQLLAADDTSPAAWIRRRRLERCRLDLADPGLNILAVRVIAARWGFTDPKHFSRLFHATYGTPPRDYRQQSLRDTQAPHTPGAGRDA
ncbi:AraC family transcriptional regulator [Embleya sp. NPDC008237]|uniref:AraC family transcriptional regulator n=1 Tax=Embleya sp. NPDC008237 TaxID=3363978 RepID=UPI0036E93EA0